MNIFKNAWNKFLITTSISDFDDDGVIRPSDIEELVNRITGVTGRYKLGGNDAERNQLSEGEGGEMEKVIKHVSKIRSLGNYSKNINKNIGC